jgi:hypothetical protein
VRAGATVDLHDYQNAQDYCGAYHRRGDHFSSSRCSNRGGVRHDSQTSQDANVPAHAMASITKKGVGSSESSPDALKMDRAMSARAMPTNAHTIQDGK